MLCAVYQAVIQRLAVSAAMGGHAVCKCVALPVAAAGVSQMTLGMLSLQAVGYDPGVTDLTRDRLQGSLLLPWSLLCDAVHL